MTQQISFTNRPPNSAWVGAVALLLLLAAVLTGCGGGQNSSPTSEDIPPVAWGLRSVTEADLAAYFRAAMGPGNPSYLGNSKDMGVATTVATNSPSPSTAVFSGSTLQEARVDEADLIKSDGAQVFNLEPISATDFTANVLRRQRFDPAATKAALIPVDTLSKLFSADVRGTGLYLDSARQQLVAIGESGIGWGIYDAWFAPQYWAQGVTELALIDTSSATQMQVRHTLRLTGQMISSRRIGSTLYLVIRSYPVVPGFDPTWPSAKTAANQAVLNSLQTSQLLPTLSIDGAPAQPLVEASACFIQPNNAIKSADIVTIVGLDLAASTPRHAARCFTGNSEAFYMSEQSLYLATTRSAYSYNQALPVYAVQTSTDIHKFALSGLDIAYRGSGNVVGHLGFDQNRKSFRLGEYQDALRVITQTAPSWTPMPMSSGGVVSTSALTAPEESPGHLSILKENSGSLTVVGELPNKAQPAALGKAGEQLYASRFIGARGYLVTYRLTDPMYILDLANPLDPKIAGELQVSGYSDYLFPLTETLLLGIGKEALSDGSAGDGRFAWYQGVKLSLIDVSDPASPRESARTIIGRRGTDATVLHDHHGIALQTRGNSVRVSLPISLHDSPPVYGTGAASDYFQFTGTELQKFEVNLMDQSLSARAPLASNLKGERDISKDRSLLWNDQVHYYQSGSWLSAPW